MKTISKKQIKQLDKGETTVRELFPEVFETPFTGWQILDKNGYLGYFTNNKLDYFINFNGFQKTNMDINLKDVNVDRPATEEEVFKALEKEAINRGFKDGVTFVNLFNNLKYTARNNCFKYLKTGELVIDNNTIFHNGKWAEIIETITKSEAEKQLNKTIID